MMLSIIYSVLLTVSISYSVPLEEVEENSLPLSLSTIDFIEQEGYKAEEHPNVQTSDGYLLDLHRIPHGKNNAKQKNKPVVFLMHGLLCSSVDWVNMRSKRSIAYQLADAGYDVWMGNARGNKYSRKHSIFNSQDADFWKFSWHEIGIFDLPAMIDYVLKVTNQKKLYYIGHSQGTTSFFVMASEKPEYNKKIRLMVALAPVAYSSRIDNPPLKRISNLHIIIGAVTDLFGKNEFFASDSMLVDLGQKICLSSSLIQSMCTNALFIIDGWDSDQLDSASVQVILSNLPAGASAKQFLHYLQLINSGKFRQYDYGWLNIGAYKYPTPPDYKTSKITAPVALFYSRNDKLSAVADVEQLAGELRNASLYLIKYPKFNHLDYLYAKDSRKLLYNDVLELLKKY